MPRPQRKKSPVSWMAGSSFTRSIQKPPQAPPEDSRPQTPESLVANRMLSYRLESARPSLPIWNCVHEIRITPDELRFEALWKRRFHTPKEPPISFECIRCYPVCIHGLLLTKNEINSGTRFSAKCPVCVNKITDPAKLEEYLKKQKLTENWGMSLTEGELITSYGLRITKSGANLMFMGGGKEVEGIDADSFSLGPVKPTGAGPEGTEDESITVDALGDPLGSELSEFIKSAESIRTNDTRDTLDVPRYAVAQDRRNKKWYVVKDCDILKTRDGETVWFKTKSAAEKYITRQLTQEARNAIEHKIEDVLPQQTEPAGA